VTAFCRIVNSFLPKIGTNPSVIRMADEETTFGRERPCWDYSMGGFSIYLIFYMAALLAAPRRPSLYVILGVAAITDSVFDLI
jgi:hypothetical protein